jgi:hypothetical protein
MALYKSDSNKPTPQGIPSIVGGSPSDAYPFAVVVDTINKAAQDATVRISKYSKVLESPDIRDTVDVLGLERRFEIEYRDKIWLEIYYDRNLTPVFGLIQWGNKWPATALSPDDEETEVEVYPSQLEFITRLDLEDKIEELEAVADELRDIRIESLDFYQNQFDLGYITSEEKTSLQEQAIEFYDDMFDRIEAYNNDFSSFFSGSVNSLSKKLFRTYTLLAYTTKDFDGLLDGEKVSMPIIVTNPNPALPEAQDDKSFKLVSCVKQNLLIIDICHNNAYPAKLPIPYNAPVYDFINADGFDEEEENTP